MVLAADGISHSRTMLLDTNILITYARAGEPSKRLERLLGLQDGRIEALASIISVAEVFTLAKLWGWDHAKQETLRELIRTRIVPIDINRPSIIDAYVEIEYYCKKILKPALVIGQNDIWIAATAKVLGCELVTTDKDFDRLHGNMLRRRLIEMNQLKS